MAIVGPGAGKAVSEALTVAAPQATKVVGEGAYGVLGVAKDATDDVIKKAYKQKILEVHPDKNISATPEQRKALADRFQAIREAYRQVSTAEARAKYDQSLASAQQATAQIQNPAPPLAIQDAPRPQPTAKKTPEPAQQVAAPTASKEPLTGPGKTHDEQVAWLWEQLGKYLATVQQQRALGRHEKFLTSMIGKHGVEKVGEALQNATRRGKAVQPGDYSNLQKSLEKTLEKDVAAKAKLELQTNLTNTFKGMGLNDKQATAAMKFSMSPVNKSPTDEQKPKYSAEDIAAVFKQHGDKIPNQFGVIAKQLDAYPAKKAELDSHIKPTAGQVLSKEQQLSMAANFAATKAGSKFSPQDIAAGVATFAYPNSKKDPSNTDIEQAIKTVKKMETEVKQKATEAATHKAATFKMKGG